MGLVIPRSAPRWSGIAKEEEEATVRCHAIMLSARSGEEEHKDGSRTAE